ncbi:hypothetical protein ACO0LD_25790 [Undibacterium sp. Ji83W]|uniref:hypothetical protein n=1 Tax=Undibacterium sp. Ji83W TaxID=3413043 RepID=UPI003BF3FA80
MNTLIEQENFFSLNTHKTKSEIRDLILRLQDQMLSARDTGNFTEMDFPVRHFFAPGSYGREMTLPAGGLIIGKIHKHAHLNIISKGHVAVLTEDGPVEFRGPCTFVSSPGTKRVVLVHEETIWTTIHVTDETDLEKIEEEVIAKNFEEIDALEMIASIKGELT